jgi:6-phosphogluconolactonase
VPTESATPAPTGPAIVVREDPRALFPMVAARVRELASAAIAARGRFRVALAGGNTPRALYPTLVTGVDWARADLFFSDERAVPPDDPRSNYRMVRETLIDGADIPAGNVFRFRGEDPDLDAAARAYERALVGNGASLPSPSPPWLDLAILGLGADGHTASLFPGTAALDEEVRLAVAVDVPALGARRLTLTYPALLGAREIFFLVVGADKAAALVEILRPGSDRPAARIVHRAGPVTLFCDGEAGRALTSSVAPN